MYISARYDNESDKIYVVERVGTERVYTEHKPDHSFYVVDPRGRHVSIFGDPVTKITPNNGKDKTKNLKAYYGKKTFEADINPINRCLEEMYNEQDVPNINTAFFDIETDFCQERGYSSPEEAFNPITSIAVYLQWMDSMVCLAIPPKGMTRAEADAIAAEVGETIIFDTEKEMLQVFLALIEDADLLSGWNSTFYDIPYTINRVIHLLGKEETRKLCLWDMMPRKKIIERNEKPIQTWELVGRVHLDYLELYKKYTYEERQSYSLDSIAEYELGKKKVAYSGTLDHLYNHNFKKFLEYNIQDTRLLDDLDKKLQFIDLANNIAHGANVLLPATMGAVAVTESAIIAEAHKRGMKVMNKRTGQNDDTRAAGGWVQHPKKGLHKSVGSTDLNSLYPSVIRALNMSPETIIGQLRTEQTLQEIDSYIEEAKSHSFAEWWNDRFNTLEMDDFFNRTKHVIRSLDMEDGSASKITGAELNDIIFQSGEPWCISANGTIFKTDVDGVIPGLLSSWYADRKQMKKVLWNMIQLRTGLIKTTLTADIPAPSELPNLKKLDYDTLADFIKLVATGNEAEIIATASTYGLEITNGEFRVREEFTKEWKEGEGYWDKRQLVRKINLNSLYGGLLNEHCRFFDQRLGQSTTLTGRSITRHMAAKANELIAGAYDETGKAIIYGDSVVGETVIETSTGPLTVEELYNQCHTFDKVGEKEYGFNKGVRVASYDQINNKAYFGNINYVYRHKVKKRMFEITDEHDNAVIVTEDHSVMIKRGKTLIEVKPQDIAEGDIVLTLDIK